MGIETAKTALITGISGQDGYYLSRLLVAQGYRVVGTSHRPDGTRSFRVGEKEVPVVHLDMHSVEKIRDLLTTIKPDEIFNLASRASGSQLFDDPIATSQINGVAVVGFLEAIRKVLPNARFCQASSSELFANSAQSPQDEHTPMSPRNAYGAAKLFAHNMVSAYRGNFGVFACSAILYNHESPRRGPEYVTRKVTSSAARISAGIERSFSLGSLSSRRDWGFAEDHVRAMWQMLQQDAPQDFVVATGQTHSVGDLCRTAFEYVGLDYREFLVVDEKGARRPDGIELRGDSTRAVNLLGWRPSVSFTEMIRCMVDADRALLTSTK